MKKRLLVLLTMIMVLSVFVLSGCTTNGNGFMKLNRQMAQLPQYSYTGDMTMALTLPESLMGYGTDVEASALAELQNIDFTFSGNYIAKDVYQDFDLGYTLYNTKGDIHFVMDKATIYINAPDLIKLMNIIAAGMDDDELIFDTKATAAALKGVTWLKIDDESDMEDLGIEYSTMMDTLYKNVSEIQDTVYDYIDTLNANSLAAYKPDIFTKTSSGYAMNISTNNFIPVTKDFITYLINNRADMITDTKDFLTNNEIAWLTAMGVSKEDLLSGLAEISDTSAEITPAQLKAADIELDSALARLNGSSLYLNLAKKAPDKYREDFDMNLAMTVNFQSMAMKLSGSAEIDATAKVMPNIPTDGVKSIEEIAATLEPESAYVDIYPSDNYAYWYRYYDASMFDDSGYLDIKVKEKNGSYYLPLRQIADVLGENITWDQTAKKAYVTLDGKKVSLAGFTNNATTYVKLREFEKLGYTVTWDSYSQEIIIEK